MDSTYVLVANLKPLKFKRGLIANILHPEVAS